MPAEHAPQAVKAGPFVFPSALPATDFENGIVVGKNPRLPYYANNAELQATYIFDQLERVLKAAGSGLDQAIKSQMYEVDLETFHDVDRVWGARMPIPPPRSSMAMRGLLVPGAVFVPNLMFLAPDDQHQKRETREGIRWHPVDVRNVNFTPGVMAGDWLFTRRPVAMPDYRTPSSRPPPRSCPTTSPTSRSRPRPPWISCSSSWPATAWGSATSSTPRSSSSIPITTTGVSSGPGGASSSRSATYPSMSLVPSRQANGGGGIMVKELVIEIDLTSRKGP